MNLKFVAKRLVKEAKTRWFIIAILSFIPITEVFASGQFRERTYIDIKKI